MAIVTGGDVVVRTLLPGSHRARLPACWLLLALAYGSSWLIPAVASAESLPASVRACASETDPQERLACYDREVASFPAPKAATRHESTTASTPTGPTPATTATVPTTPSPNATAPPAVAKANAVAPQAAQTNSSNKEPQHVSAHVVSIDHSPSELTLHLDNGQVWEEIQSVSGDLSLREGDTVTIDKHMGSYWLTGPHVSAMRVRQKI